MSFNPGLSNNLFFFFGGGRTIELPWQSQFTVDPVNREEMKFDPGHLKNAIIQVPPPVMKLRDVWVSIMDFQVDQVVRCHYGSIEYRDLITVCFFYSADHSPKQTYHSDLGGLSSS